jgi:cation diffusion facilitator CzcD-associated flavoprotein CzcO
MNTDPKDAHLKTDAIIGGGPVGLAAAAHALERSTAWRHSDIS